MEYTAAQESNVSEPLLAESSGTRAGQLVIEHAVSSDSKLKYHYAYGPPGLSGLIQNKTALFCAIFASIGGVTFGYDQGVIANILVMSDFTARFHLSAFGVGSLTAVLELGALFGTLAAGVLVSSRRYAIMVACVIFIVGSTFQCAAATVEYLFIGRAVGGIGVGALSMLCPLYISEISAPEIRGSLMALEQLSIVFGVVAGFWLGYATRNLSGSPSWRVPLALQIVPAFVLLVGAWFLPASPRVLVLLERVDEAEASLRRLRGPGSDAFIQLELLEIRVEIALQTALEPAPLRHSPTASAQKHSRFTVELQGWKRLFKFKNRDRTMVGVLMMFFQQWSGINALLYYGPMLISAIGIGGGIDDTTLLVAGLIPIVQLVAVFPAIIYIDSIGRKPLLRGGSVTMSASHILIAFLISQYHDSWKEHSTAAWVAVTCIYIFTAAYGVSFGPCGWVLPSEVFPLSMRSRGVAVSTASNWFNNFLIGLATPIMIQYSPSATFATFAMFCFLAYFWSKHWIPETAMVSLEEIDKMFRSGIGSHEEQLRTQVEEEFGLIDLVRSLE